MLKSFKKSLESINNIKIKLLVCQPVNNTLKTKLTFVLIININQKQGGRICYEKKEIRPKL